MLWYHPAPKKCAVALYVLPKSLFFPIPRDNLLSHSFPFLLQRLVNSLRRRLLSAVNFVVRDLR